MYIRHLLEIAQHQQSDTHTLPLIHKPLNPKSKFLKGFSVCSYMLVQWQTRDEGSPEVKWGLTSGSYTDTVAGNVTQYTIHE